MTTPPTAGRPEELVVRANAGLRLLSLGGVLFSVFMTLAFAPMASPASERLAVALACTSVAVVPIMLGTTAVRLRGGRLEVANGILISSVALDDVAYLDHRYGFEVVLWSGQRIDFAGSAPSLIGTLTRYWSARRMITRIQAVVDRPLTTATSWHPGDHSISRRPRTTALLACAGYMVVGAAAALVIAAT